MQSATADKDFRDWLGKISGMSRRDCRQLQDSRIAEQFLIAWHFFQARDRALQFRPVIIHVTGVTFNFRLAYRLFLTLYRINPLESTYQTQANR